MYSNSTLDFGGPEWLPPTMAMTWIKQKCIPKATPDDPIIFSSSNSDNSGPCIIPAKKKCKGKNKVIKILNSSDDKVDIADGNGHSLPAININENQIEDYQEVIKSRKRKVKKPAVPGRVSNKPTLVINTTQIKKGNEQRPTKEVKKFKIKYVEVSDSDTDKTMKGNVHSNRSQTCTD